MANASQEVGAMAGEKRLLITRIRRGITDSNARPVVELWSSNPRPGRPELQLLDLSELLTVGIDPDSLEEGETRYCRLWAYYTERRGRTQNGALMRDVVRLEPALPEGGDDVTELLREHVAILARIEQLLQMAFAPWEGEPRMVATVPRAPAASARLTAPGTKPESASNPEPVAKGTPPAAEHPLLNEDVARRHFSRDAGPAIRNGLVHARFVRALTRQVNAGALSWRSALEQLQEQLVKADVEEG